MIKYLFKEKKLLIYYVLFVVLDGINVALLAYFLKYSLDVANKGSYSKLNQAWIVILLYLIFYSFISWCTRHLKANYLTKTMLYLKQDIFKHIMRYDIKKFNSLDYPKYVSIFNNDVALLEKKYFESIFMIIRNIIILVFSCIMLFYIQPLVAIVGILLSFLPLIVTNIFKSKLDSSTKEYSDSLKDYNSLLSDCFSGFETIKSFFMESNIINLHNDHNKEVEETKKKSYYVKANADVSTNFIAIGTQFAVYLVSGYFVIKGSITAGGVIAITQLMYKVVNPVFDIIDANNNIKSVKSIESDICEILKSEPTKKRINNLDSIEREIIFNKVSYQYKKSDFKMNNISLKFEKGKKYAIVGESGSGKSTLVKLLLGYDGNFEGEIRIDNYDLLDINPDCLYQVFSVMQQNVFLFNDSILNNITLYNQYNESHVNSIIQQVGLNHYVSNQKDSLQSKIEGNGTNLSGGEKQRIALARVLVRKSDCIILDEATSNLDNETMTMIEKQIVSLEDQTCITITHRYQKDLLEKYDEIFVLKNGMIYESGTFRELMNAGGEFYNLYTIFVNG